MSHWDDAGCEWMRDYPFPAVMEAFAQQLAATLWELRKLRGYTRVELVARLTHTITEHSLLGYEHGGQTISLERLLDLCLALEVPLPLVVGHALARARHALEGGTSATLADGQDDVLDINSRLITAVECVPGMREPAAIQPLVTHGMSMSEQLARVLTANRDLHGLTVGLRNRLVAAQTRAAAAEADVATIRARLSDADTRHQQDLGRLRQQYRDQLLELTLGERWAARHRTHRADDESRAGDQHGLPDGQSTDAADGHVGVDVVGRLLVDTIDGLRHVIAPDVVRLDEQEMLVMACTAGGMETHQISVLLDRSISWTNQRFDKVHKKLGVDNRQAALVVLFVLGWMDPTDFDDVPVGDGPAGWEAIRARLMPLTHLDDTDREVCLLMACGDGPSKIGSTLRFFAQAAVNRVVEALDVRNRCHAVTLLHGIAASFRSQQHEATTLAGTDLVPTRSADPPVQVPSPELMRRDYEEKGWPIHRVAAEHNVSKHKAHRMLENAGTIFRPPGRIPRRQTIKETE